MLFLLITLGKDRYALDVGQIAEVLPLVNAKEIPQSPPGVAGVFNYRGSPVPIVDLSVLVLGRPSARHLGTRLVLVHYRDGRGRSRLLGLIAEHATDTMRRDPSDFVPPGVANGHTEYLGPVASDARGVIQWIDAAKVLPTAIRDVLFTDDGAI
jgi:chemotaxis-related protein WspB